MTPDWNWFFSSLSQSAAAIVGIFGAFIITKIFSNQTIFLEKKSKIKLLITQAHKISDKANSHNVAWYNKTWDAAEYEGYYKFFDEKFPGAEEQNAETDEAIKNYVDESHFSLFSEESKIIEKLKETTTAICLENKERRLQRASILEKSKTGQPGSAIHMLYGRQDMMQGFITQSRQRPLNALEPMPWEDLKKIRTGVQESHLDAKHHARVVSDFLDSIKGNPESPPQITYSLILVLLLFFVGVIYPLSFMPASSTPNIIFSLSLAATYLLSLKGFFLGIISTAFTVIVMLFFYTNIKMKYPTESVNTLQKLAIPENYCENFKFLSP
ncbi:hypothetical protein OQ519_20945 [Pseudomonas lurida]|uniref:hypothetical protein n=1 Tax=Pseudomonas lurida TaxID=244566 RepID=UPI00177B6739|nr:hypothetical protein [Pseudomonas lurida]MBD8668387.1 hypothetical protein [Pseudomonas lurida]UZQ73363.1 hypothetical protein OQ519_20945 [Pseudomonas lurida]